MALYDYFKGIEFPPKHGGRDEARKKIAQAVSNYLDKEAIAVTNDEITDVLFELSDEFTGSTLRGLWTVNYLAAHTNPFLKELGVKRGRINQLLAEHLRAKGLEEGVKVGVTRGINEKNPGSDSFSHIGNQCLHYKYDSRLGEYFENRVEKAAVRYDFFIRPRS